jgi:hypothetical protein
MKITKRQLRRIIKEELTLAPGHGGEFGIFDPDYIYNMLAEITFTTCLLKRLIAT